jgi:hypothetical protein
MEEERGERGKGEGSRRNGQKENADVRGLMNATERRLTWLDFGDATFPLFSARLAPASGSSVCVFSYVCMSLPYTPTA